MTAEQLRAPGDPAVRVERVLYFSLGVGGLVFLALALGSVIAQASVLVGEWGVWMFAGMVALCVTFAAASPFASRRALQALATVLAAAYALALLVWLPTQQIAVLPGAFTPWPLGVIAVATTAAAIAWPAAGAWAYLLAVCAWGGALRFYSDETVPAGLSVQETFYMLLTTAVFAALVQLVRRAGREQAATLAAARSDAAVAAAARARGQQRSRFGALVHDEVLSTLIVAARATPEMHGTVRDYARAALARVEELDSLARRDVARLDAADADTTHSVLVPTEAAARLRTACTMPNGPTLTVRLTGELPVPEEVVHAVGEALAEAVRNSLRHAGGAHCRVEASIVDGSVTASVSDAGGGFDPKRVPAERLGLRVSVLERMSAIGGEAAVASRPGHGTRVTVSWRSGLEVSHAR